MKYDNELKELNEFLLSKSENDDELKKMVNNSKFQLLIDRVLEIEQFMYRWLVGNLRLRRVQGSMSR